MLIFFLSLDGLSTREGMAPIDPLPARIKVGDLRAGVEDYVLLPKIDDKPARINHMQSCPDNSGRFFAVDMWGILYIISKGNSSTYLDLRTSLPDFYSKGIERGFHSVAFHPQFASNGKFYTVADTVTTSNPADFPCPTPVLNRCL